jgi:hypothetical protein
VTIGAIASAALSTAIGAKKVGEVIGDGQDAIAELFDLAGRLHPFARDLARPTFTPNRNGFIPSTLPHLPLGIKLPRVAI